jgi:hypothetical protein
VRAVPELEVEGLLRGDRGDLAPLDLDVALAGSREKQPALVVALDLAGVAVAVDHDDHVGLLRHGGRRPKKQKEDPAAEPRLQSL